jgi:hypothetical protein
MDAGGLSFDEDDTLASHNGDPHNDLVSQIYLRLSGQMAALLSLFLITFLRFRRHMSPRDSCIGESAPCDRDGFGDLAVLLSSSVRKK